ncbi:MAG: endonuclease domain-containing protein [Proteobacteria bacterium]|nr:endonuclease domain-containing protein [Pseudomonadota bacterium]
MHAQTNKNIKTAKLQRRLRSSMTDAEHKLWRCLRGRQLNGCKFRRQHPHGDFILDFVCLSEKLVIEVDGGQHAGSVADAIRDKVLQAAGFTVLRFWNHDVLEQTEAVMDAVYRALLDPQRTPSPPQPSP